MRIGWPLLLALAAAPLLWVRWPVADAVPGSASERPLSAEQLIEVWWRAESPARAVTVNGIDAPLRPLSARSGDATRAAEIRFEREGALLRQRLDAFSGARLGLPEPVPRPARISREAAAFLGGCAWVLLAAPWLRLRLRPLRAQSAERNSNALWWVIHASQTGQAQRLAEQTASRLRALGVDAELRSLSALDAVGLRAARRLLLVASTTGEGDAPDTAAAFVRRQMSQHLALRDLQFAVLALGDRSYPNYCAFGRALDTWLQSCAARPLFERIEVDDADPQAIEAWFRAVETAARRERLAEADQPKPLPSLGAMRGNASAGQGGPPGAMAQVIASSAAKANAREDLGHARPWQRWRLHARRRLNPHSPAPALWEIELVSIHALPSWEPGDVAVLQPLNPLAQVQAWIASRGLDGTERVEIDGEWMPLDQVLRERALDPLPMPELPSAHAQTDADTHYSATSAAAEIEAVERIDLDLLERLPRLPPREYSIASAPGSGRLRLIVRRQNNVDGRPGLGSGTLLDSPIGSELRLRLRSNCGFRPPSREFPLILIGAGSGLAGLLGLLDARIEQRAHPNWLLFGERDPQHDRALAEELQGHLDAGHLQHLDLCFSRDPVAPAYAQDALRVHADRLGDWLRRGAHLRVCGSRRGVGEGVHACLVELLGGDAVDALLATGRYRREVF
ncbi:flavodoxin domain-containing protein [Aquimonas voraii]|uniref:NADPH--hemoprotein reductase n=1 Tax=Aquimonas voraii TaxID=265719 RepID=A0A1G6YEZ9_9GAMM|nr:flavodoxin domain-containing protein [Aquimonas voraii]SDD88297.1 sulfite reductase (NADPH) flavoprotein alpha-component [Aquimonas voraii]